MQGTRDSRVCRPRMQSAWSTRVHAEQLGWKFDCLILSFYPSLEEHQVRLTFSLPQSIRLSLPRIPVVPSKCRGRFASVWTTAGVLSGPGAPKFGNSQRAATCCNVLQRAATCCRMHHGSPHGTCGDVGDDGYWPMESSSSVISPCPCSRVWDRTFGSPKPGLNKRQGKFQKRRVLSPRSKQCFVLCGFCSQTCAHQGQPPRTPAGSQPSAWSYRSMDRATEGPVRFSTAIKEIAHKRCRTRASSSATLPNAS